jgi:hypothetical protein
MLRTSRIATLLAIPAALTVAAGLIIPAADAGTTPRRKVQADDFRFCGYTRATCTESDTGHVTRIRKGTRVVWFYKDDKCNAIPACPGHNVKLVDHPRSPTVKQQDARIFSAVFNTVGTFRYHCSIHGPMGMKGKIVVVNPA